MRLSANQLSLGRVRQYGHRFVGWWVSELLQLLPGRLVELFSRHEQRLLVVAPDQGTVILELMNGRRSLIGSDRIAMSDGGASACIDRFLTDRGLDRRDVEIGLRLLPESIFARRLVLPAEARNDVQAVVVRDLTNKTPFKMDDVYTDHSAGNDTEDGRFEVWQWVVCRQFVDIALTPLRLGMADVNFVLSDSSGATQPVPFVSLRRGAEIDSSWTARLSPILCYSAVLLFLVALGLKYWNQQVMLDSLEAEIVTAGAKAKQVRGQVDQLQEKRASLLRLRLQRSEAPGLGDLWGETTRILPSHSWLTEFRLTETADKHEQQLSLTGFSGAAPSLVGIVDSSPLFIDATLTSPIALDASEGRERFALQAKVRRSEIKDIPR